MRKDNSTNAENNAFLKSICPMQTAMNQLSGKWKILLLWYIHLGLTRFGLIRQRLPTITTKMLSQQLREMEQDGLITRTIFPEMPPRVEYAITEKTKSLIPIFEQLNAWGKTEKPDNSCYLPKRGEQ